MRHLVYEITNSDQCNGHLYLIIDETSFIIHSNAHSYALSLSLSLSGHTTTGITYYNSGSRFLSLSLFPLLNHYYSHLFTFGSSLTHFCFCVFLYFFSHSFFQSILVWLLCRNVLLLSLLSFFFLQGHHHIHI